MNSNINDNNNKKGKKVLLLLKQILTILAIIIGAACGIISATNGLGVTNVDTGLLKAFLTELLNIVKTININTADTLTHLFTFTFT